MSLHAGPSGGATSLSSAAFPLAGPAGTVAAPTYAVGTTAGFYQAGANSEISFSLSSTRYYSFDTAAIYIISDSINIQMGASLDCRFGRDAAAVFSVKNSTTAQTIRVYGTTTGPKYASLAHDGTNMVLSEVGGGNININTADVAAASAVVAHIATSTIAGGITDGYTAGLRLTPTYTAGTAQTVTRHNYIDFNQPTLSGAGPAAMTDACIGRFNAAAGTHKAVDSGTTKTSPGTVSAWIKWNLNGTINYTPMYTSKTS